jgi:putative mRNA 3-end processing factor
MELLEPTPIGLRCTAGGFHVDPWGPADRAVLTHAHGDHARPGSARYFCAAPGAALLRRRLGEDTEVVEIPYGERVPIGGATVSFHPSGHVLGAAQVRVEAGGQVWVVSGDYKRDPDPTCAPFEIVPCDTFVTEATFALPIFRWPKPADVVAEIREWWTGAREAGRPAVLFAYALGKAPRILAELRALTDEPVFTHGAVEAMVAIYRSLGIPMLETRPVPEKRGGGWLPGALVLAPLSASGTAWMRRFPEATTGFASGLMRIRGTRRRKGYDRGFVLSDHADWPALLRTIADTGARRVLVTHGYTHVLARYLRERGHAADVLPTPYAGEADLEPTGES